LELKLRQYETGRRFCDAIVADGGPQALAGACSEAAALPTMEELQQPAKWLRRTRAHRGASRTKASRTHVPPVTS